MSNIFHCPAILCFSKYASGIFRVAAAFCVYGSFPVQGKDVRVISLSCLLPHVHCNTQSKGYGGEKPSFRTLSLYIIYIKNDKTFKNEQRSKDAAAKKRSNTSGVGKSNNY